MDTPKVIAAVSADGWGFRVLGEGGPGYPILLWLVFSDGSVHPVGADLERLDLSKIYFSAPGTW